MDVPQQPPEFQNDEEEIVFEAQEAEPQADEQTIFTPAEADPTIYKTRLGRLSRPTMRMNLYQAKQHLSHHTAKVEEY